MLPRSERDLSGSIPPNSDALAAQILEHSEKADRADNRQPDERPEAGVERELSQLTSQMSAKSLRLVGPVRWLMVCLAVIGFCAAYAPAIVFPAICAVIGMPFLAIACLRLLALGLAGDFQPNQNDARPSLDAWPEPLPRYAVLVPLYRETCVIDQLIDALRALDYPPDRLQISFVVEQHDHPTREALARRVLCPHMRVVVVPPGNPRTKPRALNYALQDAVGDYVVVFDAEDMPEPDQLKRALSLFQSAGGKVGCVQARLGLYNPNASLLSRQFTIEYNALFGALLPVLAYLRLPVPLGGTSSHFPRRILQAAGGWDAYNVTEDADLGIRLARLGLEVQVLSSTTWEEAPVTFRVWLCQRTRWLKGWMQTYLVHMRKPGRLWRELGAWQFLGFQMLMCAMLFSALVHPVFYVLLGINLVSTGTLSGTSAGAATDILFSVGLANLAVGYLSAIALGAKAVGHSPHTRGLAWHALAMPVYWLLISLAGYRALWQLATDPFSWEKTPHHGRLK